MNKSQIPSVISNFKLLAVRNEYDLLVVAEGSSYSFTGNVEIASITKEDGLLICDIYDCRTDIYRIKCSSIVSAIFDMAKSVLAITVRKKSDVEFITHRDMMLQINRLQRKLDNLTKEHSKLHGIIEAKTKRLLDKDHKKLEKLAGEILSVESKLTSLELAN
jgi:hypothetical protein